MATISKDSFSEDNARTRQGKGPLIKVEVSPGRYVKMYRADAEARGLVSPAQSSAATATKAQPPTENKMLPPSGNKTAAADAPPPQAPPAADDFTTILGIGRASARALVANGITTFAQLRQATQLDFLSVTARQAVEQWRKDG